jgi:hypothetical protein
MQVLRWVGPKVRLLPQGVGLLLDASRSISNTGPATLPVQPRPDQSPAASAFRGGYWAATVLSGALTWLLRLSMSSSPMRRHERPSRSSNSSASGGPQEPAG